MIKQTVIAALTAAALATTGSVASAQGRHGGVSPGVALGTAAVAGTVAGIGFHEGWWTLSGLGASGSVGTSIAAGGLVGVGTLVAIDAVTQPCRGFGIFRSFGDANYGADRCAGGEPVAYAPGPVRYR